MMQAAAGCAGWLDYAKITVSACRTPSLSVWWMLANGSPLEQVFYQKLIPLRIASGFTFLDLNGNGASEQVGAKLAYDPEGPLIL
jgi:hypothetical protein